jgi:hypothetical protein
MRKQKGVDGLKYPDNPYMQSREKARLSRESAAECHLFICCRTLANYENDKVLPGNEIVQIMAEEYKDPGLVDKHFENRKRWLEKRAIV